LFTNQQLPGLGPAPESSGGSGLPLPRPEDKPQGVCEQVSQPSCLPMSFFMEATRSNVGWSGLRRQTAGAIAVSVCRRLHWPCPREKPGSPSKL
jgi:hypothetical protein